MEVFSLLFYKDAAHQEGRHAVVTAAASNPVASLWLNGMYTPQGKTAKAFTNLLSVLAYNTSS